MSEPDPLPPELQVLRYRLEEARAQLARSREQAPWRRRLAGAVGWAAWRRRLEQAKGLLRAALRRPGRATPPPSSPPPPPPR